MNSYFFSIAEIVATLLFTAVGLLLIGLHPLPIFDGVHRSVANIAAGFAFFGLIGGYIFYKDMELKHDIEIRRILGEFRDMEIEQSQKERLARRRDELLHPEKYAHQEPVVRSTGRRGGRRMSDCQMHYLNWAIKKKIAERMEERAKK